MESPEIFLKDSFEAGIISVHPQRLLSKRLRRAGDFIYIDEERYELGDTYVVGFGKAVATMALEVEAVLQKEDGDSFLKKCIVSIPMNSTHNLKDLDIFSNSKIEFLEGADSNIPDAAALKSTQIILNLVKSLSEEDLLIVLISGGGSALLCLPAVPLSLLDKIHIIRQLSKSGASIGELNVVRKAISEVKGGRLALMTKARIVSFILSDIIDSPLDLIASGPTVLKEQSTQEATNILQKYNISLTAEIQCVLSRQRLAFSPSDLVRIRNVIIGDNEIALEEVKRHIKNNSHSEALILSASLAGNAAQIGEELAILAFSILLHSNDASHRIIFSENLLKYVKKSKIEELQSKLANKGKNPIVLLFGGETTVKVTGAGKGGRNQEMALSAGIQLEKLSMEKTPPGEVIILSGGTDGIDGPTDLAGAITYYRNINGSVRLQMTTARNAGLNPEELLKDNNSYEFFSTFCQGAYAIKTGQTGTNVMDIQLIWIRTS